MLTFQQLLTPSGQGNFDALRALYEGTFVCAQRLIALNVKATRSITESNLSGIRALMAAQGMPAFCETRSGIAHQLIQQAVGYAIDFNEVIAENQRELTRLLSAATKLPAPTGSGQPEMLDVAKAVVEAATASRNTMLEIARQVDASLKDITPKP